MRSELLADIWNISDDRGFNETALKIFRYQAKYNPVYRKFLNFLRVSSDSVLSFREIPCMPIEFFRNHAVVTGQYEPEVVFTSSGTTGAQTSRHHVRSPELYTESFMRAWDLFYGPASDYCVLALLPSYLERTGSSLVYMAQHLIEQSQHPMSGFYLNQLGELSNVLSHLEGAKQPTILLGVSFALLDLAEQYPQKLEHTIVMETGGMKGRRKELTRYVLHSVLKSAFQLKAIHSEYGMTELLSQAYSKSDGIFHCPPWMRVLVRESNDPLQYVTGKTGGINVIDLANIDSCSFIATQDLGRLSENGTFEVLGRFDYSDVRGCNLMVI